jgi:uncharacterized protein (TIGR00299 family) protein
VRVAHFDCFSGISGDMTLGALLDAGVEAEAVRDAVASLGLPIRLEVNKVRKGGFAATQVTVLAPEEDKPRYLADVEEVLDRGRLTPPQRDLAGRIFRRLAEAESAVHGLPLERVHFHEVGALDSLADIVGAAVALDLLGVERFTSGPVAVGGGMVQCAHGLMPVPAPGTAQLLRGVPLRSSSVKAELTTPTGAAILTTVVEEWVDQPAMTIERIGYGAGQKDFLEQPNLLRLFVGDAAGPALSGAEQDQVWVLETNLDDLTAEVVGYCYEQLLAAGALDVFSTPVFMKKNRPGILLTILAPEKALPAVEEVLFRETTTLGIRRHRAQRDKLHRQAYTVNTLWGPVVGKLAWLEGRPPRFAPEYESCAQLAREHGVPLRAVYELAQRSYAERGAGEAV